MFAMNVEPVTVTCCMDGCPARASPVEPLMAALIPAENMWCRLLTSAGSTSMPGRQADIQCGHEYYHYMIGGRALCRHIRWEECTMMDRIVVTASTSKDPRMAG